jgi:hypothetical protein
MTTSRVVDGRLQPIFPGCQELAGRKVEYFLRELREDAATRGT